MLSTVYSMIFIKGKELINYFCLLTSKSCYHYDYLFSYLKVSLFIDVIVFDKEQYQDFISILESMKDYQYFLIKKILFIKKCIHFPLFITIKVLLVNRIQSTLNVKFIYGVWYIGSCCGVIHNIIYFLLIKCMNSKFHIIRNTT